VEPPPAELTQRLLLLEAVEAWTQKRPLPSQQVDEGWQERLPPQLP
jgi:hypothetical protein